MILSDYDKSFGIMFHHFYDDIHPAGQGAISAEQFEQIIFWLQKDFQILPPEEYILNLSRNKLKKGEICLTFDDSLRCQFDIAIPILEQLNLKAFFNVYSSAFSGNPDPLEVYRYFRTVTFKDIDTFYETFFQEISKAFPQLYKNGHEDFRSNTAYLSEYPFYSKNDKEFRFFRDEVLGRGKYYQLMDSLIKTYRFDRASIPNKVFMTKENLSDLLKLGHEVGLHSDTHPTNIASLSKSEQETEYQENYKFIMNQLGVSPKSMAHPCGKYDANTLEILEALQVKVGFVSSMLPKKIESNLTVPREDHMTVLGMLQET